MECWNCGEEIKSKYWHVPDYEASALANSSRYIIVCDGCMKEKGWKGIGPWDVGYDD